MTDSPYLGRLIMGLCSNTISVSQVRKAAPGLDGSRSSVR